MEELPAEIVEIILGSLDSESQRNLSMVNKHYNYLVPALARTVEYPAQNLVQKSIADGKIYSKCSGCGEYHVETGEVRQSVSIALTFPHLGMLKRMVEKYPSVQEAPIPFLTNIDELSQINVQETLTMEKINLVLLSEERRDNYYDSHLFLVSWIACYNEYLVEKKISFTMMTVENLTNFFTSGTLNVLQIKDDDEVEMQKVDPFDSNGYVRDIGALYRQTSYRWKKIPIEEWEFYEKILIASCY